MGRRKKEEPSFHRDYIACAAERLFIDKGIVSTTMDDIAKAAQYSKATLYVYYKNKEDIVGTLVLKSMKILYECIKTAVSQCDSIKAQYDSICNELVLYQKQFPFYFEIVLGEINVDFDDPQSLPVEKEIFEIGELLMAEIEKILLKGMEEKVLRPDIQIPQTVFLLWASLSGIIIMAQKKHRYIEQTLLITTSEFLDYSFETLFRSFCVEV